MKDALGAVQSILVLGGTSEIGLAIARRLAGPRQATVVLAGRDAVGLESAAASLKEAGAGRVETLRFDAADPGGHEAVVGEAVRLAGGDLDVVVFAFGVLGDQAAAEAGGDGTGAGPVEVATTNYVAVVSTGLAVARRMKAQGHGTLIALSSVAGVRVRRANFIYGSSKAGMDGFFQGLADSLVGTGARVLIVRPGFVRTRMTEGMEGAPLATTADAVAVATVKALQTGRSVVWVPPVLRLVFAGFRLLPRAAWRRMPG